MSLPEEIDLIVKGRPVDYVFLPCEPLFVSHGEFRFKNNTPRSTGCVITRCHFVENDTAILMNDFSVFVGNTRIEREFEIPPTSDMDVRLTFPAQPVHVRARFRYEVRVSVECGGQTYHVASELKLTQERQSEI